MQSQRDDDQQTLSAQRFDRIKSEASFLEAVRLARSTRSLQAWVDAMAILADISVSRPERVSPIYKACIRLHALGISTDEIAAQAARALLHPITRAINERILADHGEARMLVMPFSDGDGLESHRAMQSLWSSIERLAG